MVDPELAWPADHLRSGDPVTVDDGGPSAFVVVAVKADIVWVEDPATGLGLVVPIAQCRRIHTLH